MEKSLRLLKLLSGVRTYSIEEIKERFEVSERSVYRYLNHIEVNGFIIERKNGRYRLAQDHAETKSLHKLFHFSEEEAYILYKSLSSFELSNKAVKGLINKLHALYNFQALSRLKRDGDIENIEKISLALSSKSVVLLRQYRSNNSATENDRQVEAFRFMPDYAAVWCLDLEDKQVKQFKISRIDHVEILNHKWRYPSLHHIPFTDSFRMSAAQPLMTIKANLTLKAYNLLREEFPLSTQYMRKENKRYFLDIPVADFHGIGRFVLGLPGDVEVLEPEEFMDFLKEIKNNYKD